MFPDQQPQETAPQGGEYLVLARKYRPQTFTDMIGQNALVTTLSNAIKANKIHHAYVLTGIRGVGKTTTARIVAKALNCDGGPSITWADDDTQCKAIAEGRHVDVLEFDAASHTGVEDIRDLFEGVHYPPIQGRYKIYIIDEVHMLSKAAFNALLKTLEEPPAQVKFIFATTEVHKIPVTVLSRCQRFDLRRVSAEELQKHFENLLQKEEVKASPAAIRLIARAADGSVRDGLSLLDQAIALAAGEEIDEGLVTSMLGLADRGRVYELFEHLLKGETQPAMEILSSMYAHGHDPLLLVSDMMSLCHTATRLKIVPGLKDAADLTELDRTKGVELADALTLEGLGRAYQMLLTALSEAKVSDRPFETVEMAFIRIAYLAPVAAVEALAGQAAGAPPAPKQAEGSGAKKPVEPQQAAVPSQAPEPEPDVQSKLAQSVAEEPAPWEEDAPADEGVPKQPETPPVPEPAKVDLTTWDGIVRAVNKEKPYLGAQLAGKARVESVEGHEIKVNLPSSGLKTPDELKKELAATLKFLDGKDWEITLVDASDAATVSETKARQREANIEKARQSATVRRVIQAFPGAEVVDVIQPEEGETQ